MESGFSKKNMQQLSQRKVYEEVSKEDGVPKADIKKIFSNVRQFWKFAKVAGAENKASDYREKCREQRKIISKEINDQIFIS